MANSEDRNFEARVSDAPTKPSLAPADPITVAVALVYACLNDREHWFLVKLEDSGELAVAALDVVAIDGGEERAHWTLVEEDFLGDGIRLNARGIPEQFETIECPICMAHVDITFSCDKKLGDIYAFCPKCGYRIDDVAQYVVDDIDDDAGDANAGGTSTQ